MKKIYFLRTNGFDAIVSYDGEEVRIMTESIYNDTDINAGSDEPSKRAMEILSAVEDDSSWDVLDCTIEECLGDGEVLAEMDAAI